MFCSKNLQRIGLFLHQSAHADSGSTKNDDSVDGGSNRNQPGFSGNVDLCVVKLNLLPFSSRSPLSFLARDYIFHALVLTCVCTPACKFSFNFQLEKLSLRVFLA